MIPIDETERQSRTFFRQLASESDRGAALIGCSLLEDDLEQLLRSAMSRSADQKRVDSLFSGFAPLATFSAKISVCYALGLIDETLFHDLEIIRKIRNRFAHDPTNKEFFDAAVFQQLSTIRCTYPIGTSDYAGATLDDLKSAVLEYHPADGQEPQMIEMSSAKSKFHLSVYLLSGQIRRRHAPKA
jgi:DNA-binding MltR family transcriptional regulator